MVTHEWIGAIHTYMCKFANIAVAIGTSVVAVTLKSSIAWPLLADMAGIVDQLIDRRHVWVQPYGSQQL